MADLAIQPLENYGQLLSAIPLADSTIATQSAQQNVARANVGNIQANTNLLGAQTQGANIANQRAGLQLQYAQQLQGYLAGGGGQAPQASGPADNNGEPGSLSSAGIAPDQIQAGIDKKFYVNPAWSPQEMKGLALASSSGQPGAVEVVTALHDKRVQAQQAASTQQASSLYDTMHSVASIPDNAPTGTAISMLERSLDPAIRDSAKHIQTIADQNGLSPKETDKLARTLAAESGGATFVYSKYAAEAKRDTDGVLKDVRGRQVLESAQSGLSAQQKSEQEIKLASPVDTGAPAKVPLSQFASRSGVALPGQEVPPPSIVKSNQAPSSGPDATPGGPLNFKDAPAKPSWMSNPNHIPAGTDKTDVENYSKAQEGLTEEAGRLSQTQQEIVKNQRMQALLPNAKTGPGTATTAAVQTVLGNMTGNQFSSWLHTNPSAYTLLSKQLGQSALDDRLKEMTSNGAQVKLGAAQDNLILNKLSASPEMPKDAIKSLLDWNAQQLKYDAQRQKAIPSYIAQGKDARFFDNYYSQKNPLQDSLSTAVPKSATIGSVAPVKIASPAEARALKPGTVFITPDGRQLVR